MKKIILATIITLSLTNVNAMDQINESPEQKRMAVKHLQSLLTKLQQPQTLVNPDKPTHTSESDDISEKIKQLVIEQLVYDSTSRDAAPVLPRVWPPVYDDINAALHRVRRLRAKLQAMGLLF